MGYEIVLSPQTIRAMFRKFLILGYTPNQAGNLIGKLMGLAATQNGWTVKELIHMLYLQDMDNRVSK
jgi:hypothetical protein